MSSALRLDASIAAAIEAGRAIVVPDAQRAAALRFAWARSQLQRGAHVWSTPVVLTWDAWLARQWRDAALAGRLPAGQQLLGLSQERLLWETVLRDIAPQDAEAESLRVHAPALMRAAARATQSLLDLDRSATTEEEQLLRVALTEVRARCVARGWMSLGLALPEALGFLAWSAPPLITGQLQLSALQQALHQQHWSAATLAADSAAETSSSPSLRCARDLDAELAACARWCREQLIAHGNRRLLVISAHVDPSLATLSDLLWRHLAQGSGATAADDRRTALLAVEGGESLLHQAVVADAVAALGITADEVATQDLLQLLRSPWFDFGSAEETLALQVWLGRIGQARWRQTALRAALEAASASHAAALRMLNWLQGVDVLQRKTPLRSATQWAGHFSHCLTAAGFARARTPDSRDSQRLARWAELLDEFAGLDTVSDLLDVDAARQQLVRLARQAVHQPATGDVAITLTRQLHDPLVHYDGIWVMGLTEQQWPEPPRPDPYVSLAEQRRCSWPEAGVVQRLAQAQWLQQRLRTRTGHLVLSYPQQEGDLRHRPSTLLPAQNEAWMVEAVARFSELPAAAAADLDHGFPAVPAAQRMQPLRGGVKRLQLQQECGFRAQAQLRLGAAEPARYTEGVPVLLRGMLLHSVLESLWGQLQDQQQLLALTAAAQTALIEQHWGLALEKNQLAGAAWIAPAVLARELQRATRLIDRVLQIERGRASFQVARREQDLIWTLDETQIRLRVDRIDLVDEGQQRLLIDYKSGALETMHLQDGELRPLQLAVYATALSQAGTPVVGALLLGLKPAEPGFAGVATDGELVPGRIKLVADWPVTEQQWLQALRQLLHDHLQGDARLAASAAACRHCHLAALCRRGALGEAPVGVPVSP